MLSDLIKQRHNAHLQILNPNNGSRYFKHFKGGIYVLLEEAIHSETMEIMVIYKNIKNNKIWARPKFMFFGEIEPDVPRFKEITYNEVIEEIFK